MEFQNNQVEFLGLAPSNEEDMLRAIEEAGRTCYRSEDLITPISYRAFFLKLFKRTHFSVLEHGNIVLRIPRDKWPSFYHNMIELIHITKQGGFFEVAGYKNNFYVAGNLRAWIMLLVHIHKITGGDLPRNPLALALFMHLLKFYPFIFGAVSDTIPSDIVHYRTLDYPEMELVDEKEQMRLLIESNFKLNLPLFIFRVKTNRGMCYDDKTKVLTKNGWKNFSTVTKSDEFYTLNDENRIEYLKPTQIVQYDYNGELDRYRSTQIDLLVTPNHNMWVKKYEGNNWEFIQSQDMNNKKYLFNKSCSPEQTESEEYFSIDSYVRTTNSRQTVYPSLKLKSNELFTLLGFWITDGSIYFSNNGNGNRLSISQTKQPHRGYLLETIESLGLDYYVSGPNIRINSQPLLHWIANNFLIENNTFRTFNYFIPRWIFSDLSYENKKHFLHGIILGNGTPTTGGDGYQIYTSSYRFCEDVVELCLHLGIPSNIRTINPRERFWSDGRVSPCKESYVISIHKRKFHLFDRRTATKSKEFYNGKVYCAELPKYHRLFVMRNGKPCWCGNTHEIVRNRTLGFSQESTRYVNYFKKIGLRFFDDFKRLIAKPGLSEELISDTKDAMLKFYTGVENLYNHLVDGTNGPQILTPEFARNVLPNSLMSEIIISGRLGHGDDYAGYDLSSQFTHFIKQRGSDAAHPDIRPIAALMFKHIDELLSAESFPKDDK